MRRMVALAGLALIGSVAVAKQATVQIKVPKMDCAACAVVVKVALAKTEGVKSAAPDVDKRVVTVVYEDSQVNLPRLREVIQKTGFEVEAPAAGN